MKNLWPTEFERNDLPSTKALLEEQARLLPQLTNDMVYAELVQLEAFDMMRLGLSNDFAYRFDIKGKFLKDYRFNLFSFSHDITLYPVTFRVDEKIGEELGLQYDPLSGAKAKTENPQCVELLLGEIFKSKRLKSVISSIIRLSA